MKVAHIIVLPFALSCEVNVTLVLRFLLPDDTVQGA